MNVEHAGLGYRTAILGEGIAISVTHLRESRGELHGELTVERAPEGHLMRERLNLTSSAARTRGARYLAGRSGGVDWVGILEEFCLRILDQHRIGEPVERIGRRSRSVEVPRLIDPIVPLGADVLIYGPQGSMKSTLARALAIEATTGSPIVPGTKCPRPVQVLVLDYETTWQEWNDGVARIADGHAIAAPEILYRRCHRPVPEMLEQLATLVETEGVGLVIIDSLIKATGAGREAEGAEASTARLFEALRALKITSWLVDHVAGADYVNGRERPITKAYGSVMKGAWARAVYELKRERDPVPGRTELVLRCEKINDAPRLQPMGLAVIHDGISGPIRIERSGVEAPDLVKTLSQAEQMRRLLQDGALSDADIATKLGIIESNVRTILTRHTQTFTRLTDGRVRLRNAA